MAVATGRFAPIANVRVYLTRMSEQTKKSGATRGEQ